MSKFGKKLDTWIDEEIEVPTIDPVIRGNRVVGTKPGKRTVTQKTRYTELSAPRKVSCKAFEHDWWIPDKHNHVAHCKSCTLRRLLRAVYEKVADGKILDRDTEQQLA